MALATEDKTEIGQMIALALKDNLKVLQEGLNPPADPEPTPPVTDPEVKPKLPEDFSMESLATLITTQMEARDATKNDGVMEVLFKEKLASRMASTPGLEEYLEAKDDYGKVRMEQITQGDYESKLAMLDSVAGGYEQALAGEGGRAPVVSKKVQEQVKANEAKYSEIDEKLQKGEYASVNDMAADFMNTLDLELAGVA